jgi:hypothetical protein
MTATKAPSLGCGYALWVVVYAKTGLDDEEQQM